MVTKRDDDRPTTDRVNIEQSATGRLEGRVLQYSTYNVNTLLYHSCTADALMV